MWMPAITGISYWDNQKAKHVGWFSFPEGLIPVGLSFSKKKKTVVESWTIANSVLFPLDYCFCSGSCFIPHVSPQEH